uniref:Gap junction protein n=1 Tax=Ciona savignyi TaxID=51511 RepID=H2Y5A2_CIOSA
QMAWHIIHSLLEQVRLHSTFPGKLWIIMMFIFRIVVVARIGDMVYHDEQSHFVCNTLSPGCSNVCFNAFSPISQLRFWSLMVLVVSTPGILFCIYASHKIYHAYVKSWDATSEIDRGLDHPRPMANGKRRRGDAPPSYGSHPSAPPLYVVKRLNSKKDEPLDKNGKPDLSRRMKDYDAPLRKRHRRPYWWHVVIRTILEVGFLVGQYYLYGWFVPELFECARWPCPKTVDCFVSRPMEKTCLLWLMFGLGAIACVLSIGEFWALGW